MALRDQPYLPLYVQDYLTDEKLNNCSPASQGIYIKIMCLFHKCDPYGGILLKQNDKQNQNICLNFARKLAKQLPFDSSEINDALCELLYEKVLLIDGDFLYQKRMVKDNELSNKRSEIGSKGGKKTQNKNKNFAKANIKANSEYEYDIENESEFKEKEITKGKNKFIQPTLEQVISYCNERQNNVDPVKWINFYTAKDWMIGKNKMKDWKAAVRTWENNNLNILNGKQQPTVNSEKSNSGVSPAYKADILRRLYANTGTEEMPGN